ncbi:type I-B CRISPR-associated protein Cas7/Cst2/DevR [Singulisphaera rosea]
MNLFATVLTHAAPTANYRGESELNRTVIQKLTDGRFEYPIVSPEAMRNALREILASPKYNLDANRERIHPTAGEGDEKQQLAVKYQELPDPEAYADDFLFGYLLAVKGPELQRIRKEKGKDYPLKRDSILRMNLAKGLEPYRHATVFTQSPMFHKENAWKVGGEGGTGSALLHRETADTAFQYPFALNCDDCREHPEWAKKLLGAIGELANVSGNHARSLFFMAPASIIVRLTDQLSPGYEQYHFTVRRDPATNDRIYDSKLLKRLLDDESFLPRDQFYVGGEIVETLTKDDRAKLGSGDKKVTLDPDPTRLLQRVAEIAFG